MDKNNRTESNNSNEPELESIIAKYCEALSSLKQGRFDFEIPLSPGKEIAKMGEAIIELKETLEKKTAQSEAMIKVKDRINAGLTLDDVLDFSFEAFREIIPYNRIGFALIEDDGKTARAHWARSDASEIKLANDYSASLEGSSLQEIIRTGKPRILNDLEIYLKDHLLLF